MDIIASIARGKLQPVGACFRVNGTVPIEPHIPDEATEASLRPVLEQLDYGIAYYEQGEPVPVPEHMPSSLGGGPARAFKLEPVMGVYWKANLQRDLDLATVYLDGKPYVFPSNWVHATVQRHFKMKHDVRMATITWQRKEVADAIRL